MTVDGVTRQTGRPFIVMATENPAGSAGTQLLPESQLDRFMICVKMGYPDRADEIEILKRNQKGRPAVRAGNVLSPEILCRMQEEAAEIYIHDLVYGYIADLVESTRNHSLISLGVSPQRGCAMSAMSRARAWLKGRQYVVPEDVSAIFTDTAATAFSCRRRPGWDMCSRRTFCPRSWKRCRRLHPEQGGCKYGASDTLLHAGSDFYRVFVLYIK